MVLPSLGFPNPFLQNFLDIRLPDRTQPIYEVNTWTFLSEVKSNDFPVWNIIISFCNSNIWYCNNICNILSVPSASDFLKFAFWIPGFRPVKGGIWAMQIKIPENKYYQKMSSHAQIWPQGAEEVQGKVNVGGL